ncbi:hypothetical protein EP342_05050 [bacterium]|nr:MAG: hypothetical protein EP342_05050 [bacterium]
MLALINILYLLLPITQTGTEIGANLIAGPSIERTKLESVGNQTYFYDESSLDFGGHYGVGIYLNHYFDRSLYLGLKANYRRSSTTFLEYEPELINIEGEAVEGEFEHYFKYTLEQMNFGLNLGYRLGQTFSLEGGLVFGIPITNYTIHSKETIVKPVDAGVFQEEGTRIRNELRFSTPSKNMKIGAMIGATALFPMNKSETVFLKPSINYNHFFSENVDILTSWTTDYLDLSLGISMIIGNNEIFANTNEIKEPEFAILLFELNGNTEKSIRDLKVEYVQANEINSTNTQKLINAKNRKLVSYVGIKNLLDRTAAFRIMADNKIVFQQELSQESNKFTFELDKLISDTKEDEITFEVATEDGFNKSQSIRVSYYQSGEINYILTNDLDSITSYIGSNKSKKYELYTDENISQSFDNMTISNLTVLPKQNFPYHFDELKLKKYLLVVD